MGFVNLVDGSAVLAVMDMGYLSNQGLAGFEAGRLLLGVKHRVLDFYFDIGVVDKLFPLVLPTLVDTSILTSAPSNGLFRP